MARGSLVAVTYPVDGDFVQINTSVLQASPGLRLA